MALTLISRNALVSRSMMGLSRKCQLVHESHPGLFQVAPETVSRTQTHFALRSRLIALVAIETPIPCLRANSP